MKNCTKTKVFALATLTTGAMFCGPGCSDKRPPETCFTVVSTSDVHGAIFPHQPREGEARLRRGGLIGLSGYLRILRERYGSKLLLVDGGDLYQGTLVSNLSRGRAVIEAYNLLGYHAAALGNHELDFGRLDPESNDVTGVAKKRISEARFSFLTLNVFDRKSKARIAWPNTQPSLLVDLGSARVGVLGVSTPETPLVTKPELVANLEFRDPAALIVAEATALRSRGAKAIVLVAHIGGKCTETSDPHDLSSCDLDSDLLALVRQLPRSTVDVVVGGHSHGLVAHWVHGAATIEAAAHAQQLGWVDVCLRPEGGVDPARSTIHPLVDLCLEEWEDGGCKPRKTLAPARRARFLGKTVEPAAELERAMQPYFERMREAYEAPIGARLATSLRRDQEPSLGEIVCQAAASASGAPIAVQNRGGVRADLPPGALTFGQVFEVLPFRNHITVLTLTGRQLRGFVAHLARRRNELPYLYGIEPVGVVEPIEPDGGPELRLAGGSLVRDERTYRVATNDYLAHGGEGLDAVLGKLDGRKRVLEKTMLEALIEHLEARFPDRSGR